MLKLALIALFALSLGTLTVAASYLPAGPDATGLNAIVVADTGL